MRFAISSILLATATLVFAVTRDVLVTYPELTPAEIIADYKQTIINGGGTIEADYPAFRIFNAKGPAEVFDIILTSHANFTPTVEDNTVVNTLPVPPK